MTGRAISISWQKSIYGAGKAGSRCAINSSMPKRVALCGQVLAVLASHLLLGADTHFLLEVSSDV